MAINKCYSGLPDYHQSHLHDLMGSPVSASTLFDQCEHVVNAVEPVFKRLQQVAAQAEQLAIDDTHHSILEQAPELRPRRDGKGQQLRSGSYTSGWMANLKEGHEIILFETSLGHAGEHWDAILAHRAPSLEPVLVMSDALSRNRATSTTLVEEVYGNAHARRKFYDLKTPSPDIIDDWLTTYAVMWKNEDHVRDQAWDQVARLAYHAEHSLPIMEKMYGWAKAEQASSHFEEHSGFGEAIQYFLRHYPKLIKFCTVKGAKIDNNRMEERLKVKIRSRKTSHFYKTPHGAHVANVLTRLIATGDVAGVNVLDYLTRLQQYRLEVKKHPDAWLPWNYLATIAELTSKQAT